MCLLIALLFLGYIYHISHSYDVQFFVIQIFQTVINFLYNRNIFIDLVSKNILFFTSVLRLFRYPRRFLRDQLHDFVGLSRNTILLSDKSTQNETPVTMCTVLTNVNHVSGTHGRK